jgi:hypothetical protein
MDEAANSEFGTRLVHAVREKGLCTEAGKIHHGTNSGHQAINLAYQFGARIVILIGYDMQHTDEKRHFFGDHPKGWGNANHVVRWRESMKTLAEDAKKAGLRVINSSRETALDCFERMTLEEALQCAQS